MAAVLQSEVRWSAGVWGMHSGTLKLVGERLILDSAGREVFSIPKSAWSLLKWPRYGLGATIKVQVEGQLYYVTFVPRGASLATWYGGLQAGKEWKAVLRPGSAPSRTQWAILDGILVLVKLAAIVIGLLLGLELAIDPAARWYDRGFGCLIVLWAVLSGWVWIRKVPTTTATEVSSPKDRG